MKRLTFKVAAAGLVFFTCRVAFSSDEVDDSAVALRERGANVAPFGFDDELLSVRFTKATLSDDDIRNLAKLNAAQRLHIVLQGRDFTDTDAQKLASLKNMQSMFFFDTRISEAAIDKLHESKANLAITRTNGPFIGIVLEKNLTINRVIEGSIAEAAGLLRGDGIISFAGKETKDVHELMKLVCRSEPDTVVNVSVMRADKRVILPVKIGRRPLDQ